MAFGLEFLAKVSGSANNKGLSVWSYNATATGSNEAAAVVNASGYFDEVMQDLVTGDGLFEVGDALHLHANDAHAMYVVTAVTTNVTVAAYS